MYFTDHSRYKLLHLVMQKVCTHIGLSFTTAASRITGSVSTKLILVLPSASK